MDNENFYTKNEEQATDMKQPLLKKDITPSCSHCLHGRLSPDEKNILCIKKGVMALSSFCGKFSYDPLKRKPDRTPVLPEFDESEFEL